MLFGVDSAFGCEDLSLCFDRIHVLNTYARYVASDLSHVKRRLDEIKEARSNPRVLDRAGSVDTDDVEIGVFSEEVRVIRLLSNPYPAIHDIAHLVCSCSLDLE